MKRWQRNALVAGLMGMLPSALLASPVLAAGSGLDPVVPKGQSPNGYHIWQLYIAISIPALFILLLVEGLLLTIIIRFRRGKLPQGYRPPQWHGNTKLEIVWTLFPLVIVSGIAVASFLELLRDFSPRAYANADMVIGISAHQYGWTYSYPDGVKVHSEGLSAAQDPMVIPTGTLIRLEISSTDVIHSFWVPDLTGKTDAVPGYTNYSWIKVDHTGEWRGECAELCGPGHATMQIRVRAVTPAAFRAWLSQRMPARNQNGRSVSAPPSTRVILARPSARPGTGFVL